MENITFSCNFCNIKKSSIPVDLNTLNPDTTIHQSFFRDDMFNIKIVPALISNSIVTDFYSQLEFDNEIRRIDFLLMSMCDLRDILSDGDSRKNLIEAIDL